MSPEPGDVLVIHDLDSKHFGSEFKLAAQLADLYRSGWRALDELRRGGRARGGVEAERVCARAHARHAGVILGDDQI